MRAEVDVPNPTRTLIPGMYAEITLTVAQSRGAISIPLTAISKNEQQSSAWIVTDKGELEMRKIQTGIISPTSVEVKSGVAEGEMVVLGARGTLRPGMRVTPRLLEEMPKKAGAA
jgi:multidrug efflux pump subunit AcrA (membrane-fusion protein)